MFGLEQQDLSTTNIIGAFINKNQLYVEESGGGTPPEGTLIP